VENINFLSYFLILNSLIYFWNKKISNFINVFDIPNIRKIHKKKTPLIGGYIIFLNLSLFTLLIFFDFYNFNLISDIFLTKYEYYIFYLISCVFFFIGALDDKIDISANIKLFLLTLFFIIVLSVDNTIVLNQLRFSFFDKVIYTGKYAYILTILCFLLYINACNMFDGINLQSTCYFYVLFFSLINLSSSNYFLIFILVAFLPIILLNSRGAIFMGDGGIYLCSFIISYILVKNYNLDTSITADYIFILMMLPGFDMFRIFIQRIYKKSNPFHPDNNHFHHLLLRKFQHKNVLIILNLFIIVPIYCSVLNFSNILIITINFFLYSMFIFFLTKESIFKS
tara:strand:+ start:47812 stop:48831 length:1020 start_codon:yes stop_codon:yes gene_type:complete